MTTISLQHFKNIANRSGISDNSTIKLNGSGGLKTVGWTTWKSTNRKVVSAFVNSLKAQYGNVLPDITAESLRLKDGKPLTARIIRTVIKNLDTQKEAKYSESSNKVAHTVYINNYFREKASQFLGDLMGKLPKDEDFPRQELEHFQTTVLKMAKKQLMENINPKEYFSAEQTRDPTNNKALNPIRPRAENAIRQCAQNISDAIRNAYLHSNNETGKSWSNDILHCLSSFPLQESTHAQVLGNIIREMIERNGDKNLTTSSLDNSKTIYKELCNRLGDPDDGMNAAQEIDVVNDNILAKVRQLVEQNKKLENSLNDLTNRFKSNNNDEYCKVCRNAIQQLVSKRPDLKEFFPEEDFEKLSDDAKEKLNDAVFSVINNGLDNQTVVITPESFSKLVQRELANRALDVIAEKILDEDALPNHDLTKISNRIVVACKENSIASLPKELIQAFCSPSLSQEQVAKTKQQITSHLMQAFDAAYTSNRAAEDALNDAKKTIQDSCYLTDAEVNAIDLSNLKGSLMNITSNMRKKNDAESSPSYDEYMKKLKERTDKFVALKVGLIKNIESHKNDLSPNIYEFMRSHIVESHDYSNADSPLRTYEIASKLDFSALKELGSKSDAQSISDAFLHLTSQIRDLKTKEENSYSSSEDQNFVTDILLTMVSQHPELQDILKALPEKELSTSVMQLTQEASEIPIPDDKQVDKISNEEYNETLLNIRTFINARDLADFVPQLVEHILNQPKG